MSQKLPVVQKSNSIRTGTQISGRGLGGYNAHSSLDRRNSGCTWCFSSERSPAWHRSSALRIVSRLTMILQIQSGGSPTSGFGCRLSCFLVSLARACWPLAGCCHVGALEADGQASVLDVYLAPKCQKRPERSREGVTRRSRAALKTTASIWYKRLVYTRKRNHVQASAKQ